MQSLTDYLCIKVLSKRNGYSSMICQFCDPRLIPTVVVCFLIRRAIDKEHF